LPVPWLRVEEEHPNATAPPAVALSFPSTLTLTQITPVQYHHDVIDAATSVAAPMMVLFPDRSRIMNNAPRMSSEVKDGLVFAIKVMDDYGFPLGVITEVLQVSDSWVRRHRERLAPRPARTPQPGEINSASKLVLVRMLRAEIRVPTIMEVLGLKKDAIYRYAGEMHRRMAEYPPWYRRMIAGSLVNGNEPMAWSRWNARRHARQWRTKGARSKG